MREQLAALPSTALVAFAEVMVTLEVVPGMAIRTTVNGRRGTIRITAFGENFEGLIVYLIVEHAREVEV